MGSIRQVSQMCSATSNIISKGISCEGFLTHFELKFLLLTEQLYFFETPIKIASGNEDASTIEQKKESESLL